MRPEFSVNVSLYHVFADNVESAALAAPLGYTLAVFGCVALAAFALHLRIVWHTVQLITVLALLVAAVWLRRDVPQRRYYTRKRLSTYERTHLTELEVKWHLTIIAYAAWIAYGALAHDGRHAAADAALLDGVLLPHTEIGTSFIISSLRVVLLTAVTCFSGSFENTMRVLSTRGTFVCFVALFSVLLALPPETGVPQRLSVAACVMRYAAFAVLFVSTELWRFAVNHYSFMARLCSDTLTDAELESLNANSIASDKTITFIVSDTSSLACGKVHNRDVPRQVQKLESTSVPFEWMNLARSAWVLSAPSSVATYVAAFVCIVCTILHTKEWTEASRNLALERRSAQKLLRESRASSSTAAAAAAAAVAGAKTINNNNNNNNNNNRKKKSVASGTAQQLAEANLVQRRPPKRANGGVRVQLNGSAARNEPADFSDEQTRSDGISEDHLKQLLEISRQHGFSAKPSPGGGGGSASSGSRGNPQASEQV